MAVFSQMYIILLISGVLSQDLFWDLFKPDNTVDGLDCYWDHNWVNDFDGNHEVIKSDRFFRAVLSYHNDHHEDRRFQWQYCKPSDSSIGPFTGAKSVQLPDTGYDEEWTRSCHDKNGGHAAIHGIKSWHDDHREDRQYRFWCGELDLSKHKLDNCKWWPQVNSYDGILAAYCPDGVFRSVWSKHDNHHEDRVFAFECCSIADITYQFTDKVGEWEKKVSCGGCAETEYSIEIGTESTTTESIGSSYSTALSASVSAGFEYASVTVSGETSEETSREMETSFSKSEIETITVRCDKTHLYQWLISGDEIRSDGTHGTFSSYSNQYLCTDAANPKCPLGNCQDEECQICKN